MASCRSGPTLAHASANSARSTESCAFGARPHSTDTATSCTSSAGSARTARVSAASVADGSAVRVDSGLRLRMTEKTARPTPGNCGPTGSSADGRRSRTASSSSTSRLDRCRSSSTYASGTAGSMRSASAVSGVTRVRMTRYSRRRSSASSRFPGRNRRVRAAGGDGDSDTGWKVRGLLPEYRGLPLPGSNRSARSRGDGGHAARCAPVPQRARALDRSGQSPDPYARTGIRRPVASMHFVTS